MLLVKGKYKVEASPLNLIVSRKRTDSDSYKEVAYLPTFPAVLRWMVLQEIYDADLKDLKTIAKAIEELREHIDSIPFQITIERKADARGRVAKEKGEQEVSSNLISEPVEEIEEEDTEEESEDDE